MSSSLWDRRKTASIRLRSIVRRAADLFPFTAPGLLVLGGVALALAHYGLRRIDLLLLLIGAVGAVAAILALLSTVVATLVFRLRLKGLSSVEPLRLECGVPAPTGLSVPRLGFLPLVKIGWSWVEPRASARKIREGGRLHEEIVPERRACAESIVRRIEIGDAFGLTRIAFHVREARAVRFSPAQGALRYVHVIRSIAGGDDTYDPAGMPEGERVDTRAYAIGDPIRFVLWKVFARSRQLVVRTPERAVSAARKTLAYLVAGEGDEPAAAAARVAVESGALGASWVLGADGGERDATTAGEALELIVRSAKSAPGEHGAGLDPFLARNIKGALGRAVVFVPARPGSWLEPVLNAVRARAAGVPHRAPIEFVVCTDGIDATPRRTLLSRLALLPSPEAPSGRSLATDLAAVVSALSSLRARIMIVDRSTGRVYAAPHPRALEEKPGTLASLRAAIET